MDVPATAGFVQDEIVLVVDVPVMELLVGGPVVLHVLVVGNLVDGVLVAVGNPVGILVVDVLAVDDSLAGDALAEDDSLVADALAVGSLAEDVLVVGSLVVDDILVVAVRVAYTVDSDSIAVAASHDASLHILQVLDRYKVSVHPIPSSQDLYQSCSFSFVAKIQ